MSALHRGYRTFALHHEKSLVPAFFKVSIDHLFVYNLEFGKMKYCFGKSLEFWIQKSVRTLLNAILCLQQMSNLIAIAMYR